MSNEVDSKSKPDQHPVVMGFVAFLVGLFLGMNSWITHVVYWLVIAGLVGWVIVLKYAAV